MWWYCCRCLRLLLRWRPAPRAYHINTTRPDFALIYNVRIRDEIKLLFCYYPIRPVVISFIHFIEVYPPVVIYIIMQKQLATCTVYTIAIIAIACYRAWCWCYRWRCWSCWSWLYFRTKAIDFTIFRANKYFSICYCW